MKKFLATVLLLLSVSVVYAGAPPDNAIPGPMICHDKEGKWSPQDKNCDPASCGCLFHEIIDAIKGMFD